MNSRPIRKTGPGEVAAVDVCTVESYRFLGIIVLPAGFGHTRDHSGRLMKRAPIFSRGRSCSGFLELSYNGSATCSDVSAVQN